MEADWEAEIGEGLPVIELPWGNYSRSSYSGSSDSRNSYSPSGYVNLRQNASAISQISEAVRYSVLAEGLLRLNAADSPFITAKCDVWRQAEPVDAYEFDAEPEDAQVMMASYLDVVLRGDRPIEFKVYETLARNLVARLQEVPLKNGRVDCIVRSAWVDGQSGFGLTLYAAGCGADAAAADEHWKCVLQQAVEATITTALRNQAGE